MCDSDLLPPSSYDERTKDGKPLYISVAVTNPTVTTVKDEKFVQYAVATELREADT